MIYVMSDIHGNWQKLHSLLDQIELSPDDTLYILGDIVDREPQPIGILRMVMGMENVKMLLGNHEYMMLQSYFGQCAEDEREICDARWQRNGCQVTIDGLNKLSDSERKEVFEYVKSLPLNYDIEVNGVKYLMCHGCPAELFGVKESRFTDRTFFAVWERLRPEDEMDLGRTVIFGHTSTDHYQDKEPACIWYGKGMIGIDCGGGYGEGGRISCLRLDDMKEFYA